MNLRTWVLAAALLIPACTCGTTLGDAASVADGGGLNQSSGSGPDAGRQDVESLLPPCDALVEHTCGSLPGDGGQRPCAADLQCEAAFILQGLPADGRCAAALADPGAYPGCGEDTGCSELVMRCCGAQVDGPCKDQPACQRAQEVASTGEHAAQQQGCMQALADPASFPACPGG